MPSNKNVTIAIALTLASFAFIPNAAATNVGACWKECDYVSTDASHHSTTDIKNCQASGNVALMVGNNNEANYCKQAGSVETL